MKKAFLFTSLCLATLLVSAQDLITKIPSNASAVAAIKGKNITELVSSSEFENSKLGKLFFDKLTKKTDGKVTNLASLGVDVNQNFYYYLENEDGNLTHTFLVPLKNKDNIVAMLPENTQKRIEVDQNVSYFTDLYDTTVTMWDNNTLLMVIYQEAYKYDDYSYDDYSNTEAAYPPPPTTEIMEESAEEAVEEAVDATREATEVYEVVEAESPSNYPVISFDEYDYYFEDIIEGSEIGHVFNFTNTGDATLFITNAEATCGCTVASFPTEGIAPGETGSIEIKFNTTGKFGSQSRTITISSNTEYNTESLFISGYVLSKVEEVNEEEVESVVEPAVEVTETKNDAEEIVDIPVLAVTVDECDEYGNSYNYDNDYYTKQDKEREAKKEIRRQENLVLVIEKAKNILTGNYAQENILSNKDYVTSVGKDKDEASFWINDFGGLYMDALPALFGIGGYNNPYQMFNFSRLYGGMSLTSKLNFEEDKASIKTLYTMNDEMAKYHREMYNGKMNSNFFKYFNENEMQGYFSINASTEGTLKAYPKLIDAMFSGVEKENLQDLVPIVTRLVSIFLDEEGIAKIVRGDMLFVMTGLEQKEVTYTTYEYDENYESTEVTKTKNETIPNFIFMVTSEEKEIFERLMRIGIKEGVVTAENGFYQVNIPDVPFGLSMLFKDNTLLISNSAKDIMAINNGSYTAKVSSQHKKRISKNSGSIYINGKQIARNIPTDLVPESFKAKLDYISNNVEDIEFTASKMKGNTLEGEMILNVPKGKGNKNSLDYFINLIDVLVE